MSITKSGFCLVPLVLLSLSFLQAQEKQQPKHPGDVIKFEITFDGKNANKIRTVDAVLGLRAGRPKDQADFADGFGTQHPFSPSSPNTFYVEMTVPSKAATGAYYLNVFASTATGDAYYSEGWQFDIPPVYIENPKESSRPRITVKQLP